MSSMARWMGDRGRPMETVMRSELEHLRAHAKRGTIAQTDGGTAPEARA